MKRAIIVPAANACSAHPARKVPVRALALASLFPLALLAACRSENRNVPGDSFDQQPFAGIAAGETVRFASTEPFWGGEVRGDRLVWKSPEQPDGTALTVSRFAGRGGLSFSGTLQGKAFTLAVTPGACSDGMSDRRYPFTVMLRLGEEMRSGCGWTDARPAQEPG